VKGHEKEKQNGSLKKIREGQGETISHLLQEIREGAKVKKHWGKNDAGIPST